MREQQNEKKNTLCHLFTDDLMDMYCNLGEEKPCERNCFQYFQLSAITTTKDFTIDQSNTLAC